MTSAKDDIRQLNIEKRIFIWLVTVVLVIAGLPALRNILVFILEKLYELLIQHSLVK
jgi:hypothetical protein